MQKTEQKLTSKELGDIIYLAIRSKPKDDKGRWTQTRMASVAGVSQPHFNNALGGKAAFSFSMLNAICKALDICLKYKFDGVDWVINPKGAETYEVRNEIKKE